MIPERGILAAMHLQLIWEVLQEGDRRDAALAYVASPGFRDLCDLLGMSDVPAKIEETAKQRPAALLALMRKLSK